METEEVRERAEVKGWDSRVVCVIPCFLHLANLIINTLLDIYEASNP